tara:strand:- start:234 stop:884 length:651 start_codon:yes stop_codon:yes gene_type:complete
MSYISIKNQIQEYCQQHKYQLPIYAIETLQDGHEPNFKCTLTVFDREFISEGRSKKTATFAAAEQAVAFMQKEEYYKETSIVTPKYKTMVLIDVENVPRLAYDIANVKNIMLLLVGRRDHPVMKTMQKDAIFQKDKFVFSYAEFNRKDAADIVMCIELGRILEEIVPLKPQRFIIVSNDHFAESVKDYINIQTKHTAYIAIDVESFVETIETINLT